MTTTPGTARVLIVDDYEDSALMLAEALTLLGCDTRVAHDGEQALAVAEAFQPELAFLDIGLPLIDGYEVARRLREMPGLASLRLIAVTGLGSESDRQRSREAGFDEHLVKPIDFEAMKRLLGRA